MNHADRVPRFFTSTTAAEGPINAAVELHSVLPELHICVDTTCMTHMSSASPDETSRTCISCFACGTKDRARVKPLHLVCYARDRSIHCDTFLHATQKSVVRTSPGEFACTTNCRTWVSLTAPPPSKIDAVQLT